MKFFELQIDFFLPVWRRVAVVFVCLLWAMVEFGSGTQVWGVIFAGLGVYAAWAFFFDGWPSSVGTSIEPGDSE